jgi:hypothetical protein
LSESKLSYQQALAYARSGRAPGEYGKMAVTGFLLVFLITVGSWLADEEIFPFKYDVTYFTKPIMSTMGWSQSWNAFGPGVVSYNLHSTAAIEFADGTNKLYEFPRTKEDHSDLAAEFCFAKKRTIFSYYMPNKRYSQYWPNIARFIARANDDPLNPPTTVTIFVHFVPIPPPDPNHWTYRDQLPHHAGKFVLFCYKVTDQDLGLEPPSVARRRPFNN